MDDENSPKPPVASEEIAGEPDADNPASDPVASEQDLQDRDPRDQDQDLQDIDATPTQPDEPKPDSPGGWVMPEPVFKKTSGYLPQGFEKQFVPPPKGNEDTTAEQAKPELPRPPAAVEESADMTDVEPQPDVLEDGVLDPAISAEVVSPPQKKGVIGRILMVLLALIIIGLMALVLLAVVWFVLWPRPDATLN